MMQDSTSIATLMQNSTDAAAVMQNSTTIADIIQNSMNNMTEQSWEKYVVIPVQIFSSFFGIAVIVLNIVVIKCVQKWQKLNHETRILLINLAVADTILGIGTLWRGAFLSLPINPNLQCAITNGIGTVSSLASIKGILLLSFDTFVVTTFGWRDGNIVVWKKMIYVSIVACWLLSAGLAVGTSISGHKTLSLEMHGFRDVHQYGTVGRHCRGFE